MEWLGWVCSLILIVTMSIQVVKEWRTPNPRGVSRWLYIGQIAAEVGFIIYSVAVRNWIFVVTNALLLLLNVMGIIQHLFKKSGRIGPTASP